MSDRERAARGTAAVLTAIQHACDASGAHPWLLFVYLIAITALMFAAAEMRGPPDD